MAGAAGVISGPRSRAAAVSIVSNTVLIVLKLVAGAVTGSVAVLTEAVHSAIDSLASLIAWFSVRQAEEPADEEPPAQEPAPPPPEDDEEEPVIPDILPTPGT